MEREKVIKAIEICIKSGCKDGIPNQLCPYSSKVGCDLNQILADALALLKEQNNCENCAIAIEDRQPVVRCRDCIHWDKECTEECDNSDSVCFHNGWCKQDWYCADGKRKAD